MPKESELACASAPGFGRTYKCFQFSALLLGQFDDVANIHDLCLHACTLVLIMISMACRSMAASFTAKQGQYLAFIHLYTKLNRRPPSEADMQRFFAVTPPSVDRMVVELERLKLIRRQPGVPRSIKLLVPLTLVPALE
jgi:hypothetical protein